MAIADMRRDYCLAGLSESELAADPIQQFNRWFQEALDAQLPEPNAMILGTVGEDGRPAARTVLLKGVDDEGFSFFTNYTSRKGRQIKANPSVSMVFPWLQLERQVVIEGKATPVPREQSETYFQSRPRASQLAAWASPQSSVVANRSVLEENYRAIEAKFGSGQVPLPPHWGGFRVVPTSVEFWQGRPSRLHDRLRYRRNPTGDWIVERLAS